jgi:hypothetical protein
MSCATVVPGTPVAFNQAGVMKVVIATSEGRIAPVLDVARRFLLVDPDDCFGGLLARRGR